MVGSFSDKCVAVLEKSDPGDFSRRRTLRFLFQRETDAFSAEIGMIGDDKTKQPAGCFMDRQAIIHNVELAKRGALLDNGVTVAGLGRYQGM